MQIVLYSTHCPKCRVLEKKLQECNQNYSIETDVSFLIDNGYTQVPMLKIDDKLLTFQEAVEWLNNNKT